MRDGNNASGIGEKFLSEILTDTGYVLWSRTALRSVVLMDTPQRVNERGAGERGFVAAEGQGIGCVCDHR